MGKGKGGVFCSSNNPFEESVSKMFSLIEMRKHGDKPFQPPPPSPSLTPPSVSDFAFCFPGTPLVKVRSQPATHRTIQNTPNPLSLLKCARE